MDILKIRIDLAKEYVSQLIELNESISKWLEKYVDNQGKLYDVYYWAVKKTWKSLKIKKQK